MPRGKLWILSDGYCKEMPEAMRADSLGKVTGKVLGAMLVECRKEVLANNSSGS